MLARLRGCQLAHELRRPLQCALHLLPTTLIALATATAALALAAATLTDTTALAIVTATLTDPTSGAATPSAAPALNAPTLETTVSPSPPVVAATVVTLATPFPSRSTHATASLTPHTVRAAPSPHASPSVPNRQPDGRCKDSKCSFTGNVAFPGSRTLEGKLLAWLCDGFDRVAPCRPTSDPAQGFDGVLAPLHEATTSALSPAPRQLKDQLGAHVATGAHAHGPPERAGGYMQYEGAVGCCWGW